MVIKDNQYSKIYIMNYKLNVCLSHLLDTSGTGKRAIFIMFHLSLTHLSSVVVPSACSRRDRQTGHFHCPICPVMF